MYQTSKFQKINNLFYTFSTIDDGNMSFNFNGHEVNKNIVLENRFKFFKKINIDIKNCIGMWVEGKDSLLIADEKWIGKSMVDKKYAVRCDGLITNKRGTFLFLLVADCLPVILYDPKKSVVGIVHAGWKGVDLNIASLSIHRCIDSYKCNPNDIIVYFGPAARKESFIKENPKQLIDPKWKNYIEQVDNDIKSKLFKVDFVGLCKKQYIDSGVRKANIIDCRIDTIKDKRFFSHYRSHDKPISSQGRFACLVGII